MSGVVVFHELRFAENPVEKLMEHVLSGHSTISKRTGNAAGMFQKEISFVSTFLLKKLVPFQALAETFRCNYNFKTIGYCSRTKL